MESQQLVVTRNGARLTDKDWDEWLDFIREEYLVKDGRLEDVCETLRQLNSQVTLGQFRAKLRQWGFCKNLSAENWQYIDHSIRKRKSQHKDSVVIFSGVHLRREEVKKRTNRHKPITLSNKWNPPPSPEPPAESVPLYICTPRATSPAVASVYKWPKSLPWVQFSESILPELMSGLQLLPQKEAGIVITASTSQHSRPRKKRRSDPSLAWAAFEKLVRRSMEIVMGSEELTEILLLNKSVDRIAGHLDEVIPATYLDENLRRAIVLSGGTRSEVQREVLKVLLYLVSNHLIMDYRSWNRTPYIDDARAFVDIFRLSGLTESHVLARIVEISLASLTMTAVLDLLYEAAVNAEAVDLVLKLLATDERIDIDRPVGRIWWRGFRGESVWTALEFALLKGSLDFASHMVRAGANVNHRGNGEHPPLMLAVAAEPDDASAQLVQLRLRNGAAVNGDDLSMALSLAILKGSFQLINLLHNAGADVAFTLPPEKFSTMENIIDQMYEVDYYYMHATSYLWHDLDHLTCLGLAASFSTKCTIWQREDIDEQRTALTLVKHLLSLAGPEFDVDGKFKSDAMIHAAMRGYTDVISFLYQKGARPDSRNGFLSPVYAAVIWARIESCRLLLELGGSAQADYRSLRRRPDGFVQLSPLHVAVIYNSCELVRLLVQSGVDVNVPWEVHRSAQKIGLGFLHLNIHWTKAHRRRTLPLELATFVGSWEVALLLIDLGATFTSVDLFRAASARQHQLVRRLLELNADPNKAMENGENVLQTAIRNGHEIVALQLLESGATVGRGILGLALRYGRYQTAMKLIEIGAELSQPELITAFRIPDELKLRSIFQSQLSDIFLSERSPDGRSFLENATLSRSVPVMRFALSLSPLAYDSGALCAAVLITSSSSLEGMDEILQELLRRRELADQRGPCFDRILENTAVSLAACLDIIEQLRRPSTYEIGAVVLPGPSAWVWPDGFECFRTVFPSWIDLNSSYDRPKAGSSPDISILASNSFALSPSAMRDWNNWHDPNRQLGSPLFLAIGIGNELIIEGLLSLGYEADGCSLRAAILKNVSYALTRKLIEGCTDIDACETFGMMDPRAPIHLAALSGQLNLVTALLAAGANPNAGPWYTRAYTLNGLLGDRKFELIDILLQYGMNTRGTPRIRKGGDTALQEVARHGYLGIMQRLLDQGADPNFPRALMGGNTAMEAAASQGRLDAVQLLLDSGVNTEGVGRFQYIRAIHFAALAGHSAVVQLLKSCREWTEDDWRIFQELERHSRTHQNRIAVFIHHSEYTEDEMVEVLDHAHDLEQEGYEIIRIGDFGAYEERDSRGEYLDDEREIVENSRGPLDVSSATPIVDNRGDSTDDINAKFPATNNPDLRTARSNPTYQIQTESLGEGGLSNPNLPGDAEELEIEPGIQFCFETTEDEQIDIQLGPCSDIGEERERRQEILDDMLGEREAPFQPTEWAL
ncbi:ankyrin [Hypoxylon crocopeplum]|nr:ankyrin [Hypoxylon crocopeplum]